LTTTSTERIDAATVLPQLLAQVNGVVAVPPATLEALLCALFGGGHVLLEGIPGIGKTLLARTLARCVGGEFKRIQFTNDLMPSDIVGSSLWRPGAEKFVFVRGPLFANMVLADEINRTSPRTLSCLLEAMENGRVSIEGRTVELATPFTVLATRNPIEFHGTYPVPEAALDRFAVRVEIGYPQANRELALYRGEDSESALTGVSALMTPAQLVGARAEVAAIAISEPVAEYVYRVVGATRGHADVALGGSPRAALAWLRVAKARAWLDGRDFVLPDDLKALAVPALAHRLVLHGGGNAQTLVRELVERTEVPL
jgi:MoxR-like ATPase